MLDDVVNALVCPVCQRRDNAESALLLDHHSLKCPVHHTFDLARQGYVNLLPGRSPNANADTADMVEARATFLDRGFMTPLSRLVSETVARESPMLVLEPGAGTGHYLASSLGGASAAAGIAMDISKPALRRAARAHPRIGAILSDVWGPLPIKSEAVDVIMSVFAPRNGPEFTRVLRPDGAVVVASPTERHLAELVRAIDALSVDDRKQERLAATLGDHLALEHSELCEYPLRLGHDEAELVTAMGPSAFHLDRAELRQRIKKLDAPIAVTVSVKVSTWRLVSTRNSPRPQEQ